MTAKVKILVSAAIIVAATLLAYLPAIRGGFIWDDPDHILNNPALRSPEGLRQMWTDVHSLPQWYPLIHTTFWVEYQLWGTHPLGYHLVNVLLHATSAILLWKLLHKLAIPGAWLAAAIWALHPVNVESVAWITERKNVLSGLFYFLAMMAYFRAFPLAFAIDSYHGFSTRDSTSAHALETRDSADQFASALRWYILALVLFLAALFSKTVTATLPAAILLLIWWKSGKLRWRDVLPTIPFFVAGFILAITTARLEQVRVGAFGDEWRYADSPIGEIFARCIIAGRALWFYAWKLLWPFDLAFIYERWVIDWRDPSQYLYPIGFLAVVLMLWLLRHRIGRGPLVAVLFFAGTIFPALGFVNVFPHRYSFVADHFQYLASIGLIALAAALLARASDLLRAPMPLRLPAAAALLAVLGVLSFRQSHVYNDAETLWTATTARSPGNWMTWTNLGNALVAQKRYDEAIPYYQIALDLAPHIDDVQYNAGHAAARQKRFRDAENHFREAVRIKPTFLPAWESLGDLYADELNEPHKAIDAYEQATKIAPHFPSPRIKLQRLKQRLREVN